MKAMMLLTWVLVGCATPSDEDRTFQLVVPTTEATSPRPLVLLLHGYSQDAAFINSYFHASTLAESENFLLVIPEGTKDPVGLRFWNAGPACCNFANSDVDDVAFLGGLIDKVEASHDVDPSRIYVMGHSNGGFMAHRLACELSSRIAGIASLAGAAPLTGCATEDDVTVVQIHGDTDETISYTGGDFGEPESAYPSAQETVAGWAARDGCDATAVDDTTSIDLIAPANVAETTVSRHAGCRNGTAAELWTVHGGVHTPELVPSFVADVYRFLSDHPRQ